MYVRAGGDYNSERLFLWGLIVPLFKNSVQEITLPLAGLHFQMKCLTSSCRFPIYNIHGMVAFN